MTFKEQVLKALPEGHEFTAIFSKSSEATMVKTRYEGRVYELTMPKVNINTLFSKTIVIPVGLDETFDDVYRRISERFGLGLVKGVDYYNANKVNPLNVLQYYSLPILRDSYGYFGAINCFLTHASTSLSTILEYRDLTGVDQAYITKDMWTRTMLVSEIYSCDTPMFLEDGLSPGFARYLSDKLGSRSSIKPDRLARGKVIDLINDDLSDILVLRLINGMEYLIRFQSESGDLPAILISTGDENTLDESSKEFLSGDEKEKPEWDSERDKGLFTIGALALPLGNSTIPSLPPKEDEEDIVEIVNEDKPFISITDDEDVTWLE